MKLLESSCSEFSDYSTEIFATLFFFFPEVSLKCFNSPICEFIKKHCVFIRKFLILALLPFYMHFLFFVEFFSVTLQHISLLTRNSSKSFAKLKYKFLYKRLSEQADPITNEKSKEKKRRMRH